jgi:predicted Rossmann fold nucleotide-binding protein DprA/Smf involved in DNA uptake
MIRYCKANELSVTRLPKLLYTMDTNKKDKQKKPLVSREEYEQQILEQVQHVLAPLERSIAIDNSEINDIGDPTGEIAQRVKENKKELAKQEKNTVKLVRKRDKLYPNQPYTIGDRPDYLFDKHKD